MAGQAAMSIAAKTTIADHIRIRNPATPASRALSAIPRPVDQRRILQGASFARKEDPVSDRLCDLAPDARMPGPDAGIGAPDQRIVGPIRAHPPQEVLESDPERM
jgi:hypothetical protein